MGAVFGVGIAIAGRLSLYMSTWWSIHSLNITLYLFIAVFLFPLIAFIANSDFYHKWKILSFCDFLKFILACNCQSVETIPVRHGRRPSFMDVPRAHMKRSIILRLYNNKCFRWRGFTQN